MKKSLFAIFLIPRARLHRVRIVDVKKKFLFAIFLFTSLSVFSQNSESEKESGLTISYYVDQSDSINQSIITNFKYFLASKDSALYENRYWLKSDFEKYPFPFIDLYNVESRGTHTGFYNVDLLNIIKTENPQKRLVKFAIVGHDLRHPGLLFQ